MLRQCLTCGVEYDGRPDSTLCPQCAAKSKDSAVVRQRTCRACGSTFLGGPRAWYCPECRRQRQLEQFRQAKARAKAGKTRRLGSIGICELCGGEYITESGVQKYCKKCAPEAVKEIDRRQSREWAAANIDYAARREDRQQATAPIKCVICGKLFQPDTPAKTCSPACAKELQRQIAKRFEKENREARTDRQRENQNKKISAMTPEEYRAYRDKVNARARECYVSRHSSMTPEEHRAFRDKVNARARENYRKRKEGKSGSDQ